MVVNLTDSTGYIQWRLTHPDKNAGQYSGESLNLDNKTEKDKGIFSTVTDINEDGCTDGKDDGNIGFLSAAYNVGKGAVNTGIDLAKGCVMDEQGNFSLGRTLLTAGTIAACLLVPPLGLAACGLGAATGLYHAGTGIYEAYNAKTDAEAKTGYQNIGGGTLTTAASVVGGKASYNAMKLSSTAGPNGTSAIDELASGSSIFKKTGAFIDDAWSSTKNNLTNVKDSILHVKNVRSEVNKLDNMRKANAAALEKQAKGQQLTQEEQAAIDAWDNLDPTKYSAEALNKANRLNEKAYWESELKAAQDAGDDTAANIAKEELKKFSAIHQIKNSINTSVSNTNTAQAAKNFTDGLENVDGILNKMETFKNNVTETNLKQLYQGLSADAKAVLKSITEEDPQSTISKYGYKNVMQVLKSATGVDAAIQA